VVPWAWCPSFSANTQTLGQREGDLEVNISHKGEVIAVTDNCCRVKWHSRSVEADLEHRLLNNFYAVISKPELPRERFPLRDLHPLQWQRWLPLSTEFKEALAKAVPDDGGAHDPTSALRSPGQRPLDEDENGDIGVIIFEAEQELNAAREALHVSMQRMSAAITRAREAAVPQGTVEAQMAALEEESEALAAVSRTCAMQ